MKGREDINESFEELAKKNPEGSRIAFGFRPSGELHVGNLLSLAYAAAIADQLQYKLDLMCCDTDWSAHIHEHHFPENNRVMRLFFMRDCPCEQHENVAEHRMDELEPFLEGLQEMLEFEVEKGYLTDLQGDEEYVEALRTVLENMEDFDEIFGGGFRRRYISPVTAVCENCGYSHAKGASYSPGTGEIVAPCRNKECMNGFASEPLEGRIGVYYLVDPVRDPSRDVAIHVFGGDYGVAEKGQKTSKIEKVAKITELATGETPEYFLAPMVADEYGKPLSKSKGTGRTVSEIDDLHEFGAKVGSKAEAWLTQEKEYLAESEI